jgi:hypothetical protein
MHAVEDQKFVVDVVNILKNPHPNDLYSMGQCPIVQQLKGDSLMHLNVADIPTGEAALLRTSMTTDELRLFVVERQAKKLIPKTHILKQPLSNGAKTTTQGFRLGTLANRFMEVKGSLSDHSEDPNEATSIPHLVLQQKAPQALEVCVCVCV